MPDEISSTCTRCSARVEDLEVHRRWHREIEGTDEPTPEDGPQRMWILGD